MDQEQSLTKPDSTKKKVIHSYWLLIVSIACIGPFAIPLVLNNPRMSKKGRVLVSILIIALTVGLIYLSKVILSSIYTQSLENLGIDAF
ncbi:MAG: hypothetical protein KDK51_07635 [Deltaproteobacteria bacterium]|nr:hypothetical protein [Deltaproteobacteria bacterium]